MQAIDASLKRLQTDYIDIYFIHCWNSKTPLEDSLFTLDNLVKSGKVRYLGVSNFTAWQLMKALGIIVTVMVGKDSFVSNLSIVWS